jgi:hypothetical protein
MNESFKIADKTFHLFWLLTERKSKKQALLESEIHIKEVIKLLESLTLTEEIKNKISLYKEVLIKLKKL